MSRNTLFAGVLRHLLQVLDAFDADGFAAVREEWLQYHVLQGREVRLTAPDGSARLGRVAGVAEDGALLLMQAGGLLTVHAGEISLRGV